MAKINLVLPKPHPKQAQIIDCPARFIVVDAGRRFGKSVISQTMGITDAINGKSVAYITPTYQLAKTFFKEISRNLPKELVKKNESDLYFEFITGGVIRFFTGERLDNLRGNKFHLVVVDEAAFIPDLEDGWKQAIRATLTDYKGRAIFISTPRGNNYFKALYMKGFDDPDWMSFRFTSYDNPYIDPAEIDSAKRELPEVVFNQEYLGEFSENAANPFGSRSILSCLAPMSTNPVKCYGIDLAKYSDWTVIIGLDNAGNVAYLERFQADWASTQNKIRNLPRAPMLIDSTGVGDPIVEQLQRDGLDVESFKFTSPSKQELMLGLQVAIHQERIHYPDGVIKEELEVFEFQYSAHGVKYSAPTGFHDDTVCALALAWRKFDFRAGTGRYNFM
jgi:phage FluMu gp28-like protein